jgi:hypothetical protein
MAWRDFTRDKIQWLLMHLIRILLMIFFQELLLLFTGKILLRVKIRVWVYSKKLSLGVDLKKLVREEM